MICNEIKLNETTSQHRENNKNDNEIYIFLYITFHTILLEKF